MKFREIMKKEKENMNPIRWKVNHIIAPIFVLIMIIILVVVGITMNIDEKKYTPLAICLFIFYGLLCIGLLVLTPFIRKIELKIEMAKYNFDKVKLDMDSSFKFTPISGTDEKAIVIFKENCLEIYGKEYYYKDFDIRIFSGNYLNLIHLSVIFTLLNSGKEYDPYLAFPLDGRLVTVIDKYNIKIHDKEVLDYIINNKEDAFNQIYKYGYIKKNINI